MHTNFQELKILVKEEGAKNGIFGTLLIFSFKAPLLKERRG